MVIKIFTGLEKRVEDLSETFDKEIEHIKKNQSERRNSVTKQNKTKSLEKISSGIEVTEEQIYELEDNNRK